MFTKHQIEYNKLFRILVFVCPLLVLAYCFSSGISGNDFWWHIKVGEYVIDSGIVPTKDVFSWYGTSLNLDWTAHEWLADVFFYVLYRAFGTIGIFIFSFIGAGSIYCLLWREVREYTSSNLLFTGVFFTLFAVVASTFFYGRPHIFGFFFLYFELKLLYGYYENPQDKKIWYIPIIAVAWSNLHGGSSNLSYILCVIFLLVGACGFKYGRITTNKFNRKQFNQLLLVTIVTVGALLINPIGYRVLVYPYINLSDGLSMALISEWKAPDAKSIGNLVLYFLPMLLMTVGIIGENKKIRLIDIVVMLSFMFLFFRSVRFIILWYIAATFYAFRYMPDLKVQTIKTRIEKTTVWLLIVIFVFVSVISVSECVNTYNNGELISKVASEKAISAIKKDAPKRLFNDYNLGEVLIYNNIPVFFDARADLYAQKNIMADGVSLMFLEQANQTSGTSYVNVDALIQKYNFDSVVILKSRPLYSYMISHPEQFTSIYEDDSVAYFKIAPKISPVKGNA